jgi:hypothetical protein
MTLIADRRRIQQTTSQRTNNTLFINLSIVVAWLWPKTGERNRSNSNL